MITPAKAKARFLENLNGEILAAEQQIDTELSLGRRDIQPPNNPQIHDEVLRRYRYGGWNVTVNRSGSAMGWFFEERPPSLHGRD
jgi:hypothetical protein